MIDHLLSPCCATGPSDIEEKFKLLEAGSKVDDELAMLKKQLPSGEKDKGVVGELPASINMVSLDFNMMLHLH